jgi:hypothetical protein
MQKTDRSKKKKKTGQHIFIFSNFFGEENQKELSMVGIENMPFDYGVKNYKASTVRPAPDSVRCSRQLH